jgi:Zonular occludens toxin (Zot).
MFGAFTLPFMPGSWWAVCFLLIFARVHFGKDVYAAVFRYLCDLLEKVFKKDKDRVFDMYGVYLFCGRVGTGKTISMVRRAERIKRRYPNVKIYSNFTCTISDGLITCWQDILDFQNEDDNGVNQGILFLFDEIHLTFDSQSWKDAPANLLEYISLQRHFHKCIFGSSQVWSRVNKVIREQSDWVIECKSYFGSRLIRNIQFSQEEYNVNGDLKGSGIRKRHWKSNKCFYASDKLRNLYNTDEIIGGLGITRAEKKAMTIEEG